MQQADGLAREGGERPPRRQSTATHLHPSSARSGEQAVAGADLETREEAVKVVLLGWCRAGLGTGEARESSAWAAGSLGHRSGLRGKAGSVRQGAPTCSPVVPSSRRTSACDSRCQAWAQKGQTPFLPSPPSRLGSSLVHHFPPGFFSFPSLFLREKEKA